ncbi:hypothetical protein [Ochrobactrum sp. RH2CCR150]|uniref:hypothetical protein n=1 Tax=Ochrobactrum sp. RH2CCR150 TaxID=2587044 RepID=UPI0015FBE14E|nr:hypothetical protein [Ochrobactrum sp. RH2CCR150]
MQSFFVTPINYETVLSQALMCDDELDRNIEIKQFCGGVLSPCFVKFDAEGLGVASSIQLVGPIVEAFVRPRVMLVNDDDLCFYFSIDESRADRAGLEECAKRFSKISERSALLIDSVGRFSRRTLSMVLLFDRASKRLAREWAEADFDLRLLHLDGVVEDEGESSVQNETAA